MGTRTAEHWPGSNAFHDSKDRIHGDESQHFILRALVTVKLLILLIRCIVACSTRVVDKQIHKHTHTHRTQLYRTPHFACVPRVNKEHKTTNSKLLAHLTPIMNTENFATVGGVAVLVPLVTPYGLGASVGIVCQYATIQYNPLRTF